MFRLCLVLLVLLATTSVWATADDQITGTTGAVVVVDPPASVNMGAYESNTEIRLFGESYDVLLTRDVPVDITAAGVYASIASLTKGTLLAGERVNSYLFHFDPSETTELYGSATFDNEILGVIVTNALGNSYKLVRGAPDTVYSHGPLELGGGGGDSSPIRDIVTVEADMHTLVVDLRATTSWDHVRVLTATPVSVPEPTTFALLCVGALGLLLHIRRRR
jgi:hypothetical protein